MLDGQEITRSEKIRAAQLLPSKKDDLMEHICKVYLIIYGIYRKITKIIPLFLFYLTLAKKK